MSWFDTIFADDNLPARAKTVYMYLRARAGKDGNCWPGIRTAARNLNLSESTVKRAIRKLEQHGYLCRRPRLRPNGGRTSNLYEIQK